MKIYNEVVTKFNEITGKWETISEDSFNYSGIVHLAQGLPPGASALNESDKFADTTKITAGYFTGGDATFNGTEVFTGSLESSNEKYYFNVNNKNDETDTSSKTQFSVTFGHIDGSGSNQYGDTNDDPKALVGETRAIYQQFTSFLLEENDARDGFKIADSSVVDKYIYALVGKRDRFKDRFNKKNWTLTLSGSDTTGLTSSILYLTDDSKTTPATATPGGPRYNIVSGSLGIVSGSGATFKTYGWFYPDRGVMIFSGTQLSASIPGEVNYGYGGVYNVTASNGNVNFSSSAAGFSNLSAGDIVQFTSKSLHGVSDPIITKGIRVVSVNTDGTAFTGSIAYSGTAGVQDSGSILVGRPTTDITASFSTTTGAIVSASGFAPNLNAKGNAQNALRFANCMRNVNGTTLQLRSEEDKTEENYFCRVKANEYNFSTNPTFVSGSLNKIRNTNMRGNPTTFISGIGLYNSAGQLLATAHLSKPIVKSFAAETTIKVKLTY